MARNERYDVAGLMIGGCTVLGLGIGMASDGAGTGLIIGLGAGLLIVAVLQVLFPGNIS